MACDRPNGDCTNASPCGAGCGCGGGTPVEPIVPRCQDIALTPGTYTRATLVVNAAGCISQIAEGAPELYTPDECCQGGTGGEGTGLPGPRGFQGDPGQAATIAVDPDVPTNGSAWTVENVGTPSAAIFQFTAPVPPTATLPPGGVTDSVDGLEVAGGLVTALPPSLLHGIVTEKLGVQEGNFLFTAAPVAPTQPRVYKISLNLDGLVVAAANAGGGAAAALTPRVDDLEDAVAAMPSSMYAVAVTVGVNLHRVASDTVVPVAKVQGLVANVWHVGVAYAGDTVTASAGPPVVVSAAGRITLPALAYPTGM